MHMIDERVALADLETLTGIYQRFIEDWFDRDQTRTGWQGPATEAGR
jgi:succinyl-diaminopimelate desuccinylase